MTPKERMVSAYRGMKVDTVPVAPEFWAYIPARLLGVDMVAFEREVPFWKALQQTFTHYGTEGWGIVFPSIPAPDVRSHEEWKKVDRDQFESFVTAKTPKGTLTSRQRYSRNEPSWAVERCIKDFERDWPAYKALTLGVPEEADWSEVRKALDAVGDDYLLEVMVGNPFFDYIASGREGGLEQGIFDLMEHESFFEELHEIYIDFMRRLTRQAFIQTAAESVFIGGSWSCISLLSPAIWRRWDKPVIQAVAEETHKAGKLLHIHFHGRCKEVLKDLTECGADCICPFERPPGGDITDLSETRKKLEDRVTVNGNVHTVETLIRGNPDDVRRQVEEIFSQWGPDTRRLILGTGDQVGAETPDENIFAMIEAGRRLGKQP